MLDMIRLAHRVLRLRRLGRLRPPEVRALQERRWRDLVQYAAASSPFYRQRLRGIDLDRCRPADLPSLSKAEMMAHFDDLVTDRQIRRADVERFIADPANLGRPYLGRYAVCHTSGSQGQPALVVQPKDDILLGLAAQLARGQEMARLWPWVFRRIGHPVRFAAVTQRPGFYPTGAVFSYLAAASIPLLDFLHLSVFDPIADVVERLNEFQPEFLASYPSELEALAREQRAGRLRLRPREDLRLVSMSEPLTETSRAEIEAAFGVHLSNHYAMAECSALSTGCPRHQGAHINSDLALLEVVDDQGRPVPDGTPGSKVLITNLYNRIQPLIRYEIGDVVTLSPSPCPCGSPFPLVANIHGRTEERFWVERKGEYQEIPYFLFLAALHHDTNLAEHQVLQTGRNHFVVRAAPQRGKVLSVERLDQLVRQSVAAEGLDDLVDWEIEVVPEIRPDPGSGKMHRVKSLVGPPPRLGQPESHASESVFVGL
jgi:phenylacetate-CoA ligase